MSRFGWQPPVTRVQRGWSRSCKAAQPARRARTCSSIRSSPPVRNTLRISCNPLTGSSTLQKTRLLTAVSKAPSRNGSASAVPTTSGTVEARWSALNECGTIRIKADHLHAATIKWEVSARAASDFERPPRGAVDEPPAPATKAERIENLHDDVVEPRHMFYSAHHVGDQSVSELVFVSIMNPSFWRLGGSAAVH